jgi:SAM-dependent methyltransferase
MEQKETDMPKLRTILCFVVLFAVVTGFGAARSQERAPDVHYVPTPEEVVMQMLKMAKVGPTDMVYDLGCGDGRIVITAAKLFGARGIGIDIDPVRIRESKENALKAGVTDRVKFVEQDLFKTDFHDATVVFLYLLPELNLQLRPKLLHDLKPGTRIISHEFNMGDWKPDNSGMVPNVKLYYNPNVPFEKDTYFYYWVVPAEVAGEWRFTLSTLKGIENVLLHLAQTFQEIQGELRMNGRKAALADAQVAGDEIRFTLGEGSDKEGRAMRFTGRVKGSTITGNVEVRGGDAPGNYTWSAQRMP